MNQGFHFDLQVEDRDLRQWAASGSRQIHVAFARGMNKAVRQARSAADTAIRNRLAIKKRDLKRFLLTRKATVSRRGSDLNVGVITRGEPIPMSRFRPKETRGSRGRRRKGERTHVTVEIRKGRRIKLQDAFIVHNAYRGEIFRRKGKRRGPLKMLYGPSLPGVMRTAPVQRAVREVYRNKAPGLIRHEVNRQLVAMRRGTRASNVRGPGVG